MKQKRTIKLKESDLRRIISESIDEMLNESSYDKYGNFDEDQHNADLIRELNGEVRNINQSINDALRSLSFIENEATNDIISKRARVVINTLITAGREMEKVSHLISANIWNIN